jgi:hypothetical protein
MKLYLIENIFYYAFSIIIINFKKITKELSLKKNMGVNLASGILVCLERESVCYVIVSVYILSHAVTVHKTLSRFTLSSQFRITWGLSLNTNN